MRKPIIALCPSRLYITIPPPLHIPRSKGGKSSVSAQFLCRLVVLSEESKQSASNVTEDKIRLRSTNGAERSFHLFGLFIYFLFFQLKGALGFRGRLLLFFAFFEPSARFLCLDNESSRTPLSQAAPMPFQWCRATYIVNRIHCLHGGDTHRR